MLTRTAAPLLAAALLPAPVLSAEPAVPSRASHVTWSVGDCAPCHAASGSAELEARLSRPCRALCDTCHDLRGGHHPVGVVVPGPVAAPLLLARDGKSTCATCHDVSGPRFASSPWTSRSLFARLSRPPNENRTFYLVVRNDHGQLCRACH